jgi:hypothetical protein
VHRGWHVAGDVVVPEDASVVSPTVQFVFVTHTAFVVDVAAAICRSAVEGVMERVKESTHANESPKG